MKPAQFDTDASSRADDVECFCKVIIVILTSVCWRSHDIKSVEDELRSCWTPEYFGFVPDVFLFLLSDLRNGSAVFWQGGVSGGYQVLLLDEDQGWLLVGGKDHIYLLSPDSLDLPTRTVRQ